jgi:hypothetical protein
LSHPICIFHLNFNSNVLLSIFILSVLSTQPNHSKLSISSNVTNKFRIPTLSLKPEFLVLSFLSFLLILHKHFRATGWLFCVFFLPVRFHLLALYVPNGFKCALQDFWIHSSLPTCFTMSTVICTWYWTQRTYTYYCCPHINKNLLSFAMFTWNNCYDNGYGNIDGMRKPNLLLCPSTNSYGWGILQFILNLLK